MLGVLKDLIAAVGGGAIVLVGVCLRDMQCILIISTSIEDICLKVDMHIAVSRFCRGYWT